MNAILLLAQANPNIDPGAGAAFGGLLALGAFFWIIALALSIFWIWALVDVLTSAMPTGDKVLWFLVVFFLHIIGAIIYFAVGRPSRTYGATSL
jgi:hypothetical protein